MEGARSEREEEELVHLPLSCGSTGIEFVSAIFPSYTSSVRYLSRVLLIVVGTSSSSLTNSSADLSLYLNPVSRMGHNAGIAGRRKNGAKTIVVCRQ